jgi:hypothetical protein
MPKLRAEETHADEVVRLLHKRKLKHLRAVRRGDLITLVSGDDDNPFSHARVRRVSSQLWRLEMPSHTRWQPTPFEGTLGDILSTLVEAFGWTVAKLD